MERIRNFVSKAFWILTAISLLGAVGSLIGIFLTPSYRNDPYIISLLSCLLSWELLELKYSARLLIII